LDLIASRGTQHAISSPAPRAGGPVPAMMRFHQRAWLRRADRRSARRPAWRLMARWCLRGFIVALLLALLTIALAALRGSGDAVAPSQETDRWL